MSDLEGKGQEVKKQINAMFILKKVVNCLETPMLSSSRKPNLGCPTQFSWALHLPSTQTHTVGGVFASPLGGLAP